MSAIKDIRARQILDSRGIPTVECDVETDKGIFRGMAPSGASTGRYEDLELRDGNKSLFGGKSVLKAVDNLNNLASRKVFGVDCKEQAWIDNSLIDLDGTENKSNIGANAIVALSMAVARAGAAAEGVSLYKYLGEVIGKNNKFCLPVPMLNVMDGGKHMDIANDVQEHMIMPVGAKSFSEAMMMSCGVYNALREKIHKKFGIRATAVANEGGFLPPVDDVNDRLEFIEDSIDEAGCAGKVKIALDFASSEFYSKGKYSIGNKKYSSGELIDFYSELAASFDLFSIEDGMAEDDWEGWRMLNSKLGKKVQIVGDDLLVTNSARIKKAIELKAVNAVLIKLNQIGTVTETIEAINAAHSAKFNAIVSHRCGETEDSFIADFAVGLGANQIKAGAPARSDRNAKYNQLLRIEEELNEAGKAEYAKISIRG